ncbi:MAG: diguanylate cyclase [Gemmatimonadaceae bacterium]|nr:diguanylate cyclase [Gemmatimonadaceae bacterium]
MDSPDMPLTPFRHFTRLAVICLSALFLLGIAEWYWVRRATAAIASVPTRTVLVTQQRMYSTRVVDNTIAFMQAQTAEARVPWRQERLKALQRLSEASTELTRFRILESKGPSAAGGELGKARLRIARIVARTDSLVSERLRGERGMLQEDEIRALVTMNDSVSSAIERVNNEELAWARNRTDRLQRGQLVVFMFMGGVLLLMVFVVMRPAAHRMGDLAIALSRSNAQLADQAHTLEESATELAEQNAELVQHQIVMEQHRTLLEELQQSLSEREARHRSVLESMAEGMVLAREDGVLLAWNNSALNLLGVSEEEMRSRRPDKPLFEVRDEAGEILDNAALPLATTMRTGEPVSGMVMQVHRNGESPRWLRLNARLVESLDDSEPVARTAVLTFVDVTAERAQALQLRSLSIAVEQTDQAIAMADARLRITWVNKAWMRTTGFTLDEARGKRPGELLHGPHTAPETVERMRAAVRNGESIEAEVLNYRKDGTPFWMEVHTAPLRDGAGHITSWISVQRDITSRKASERERQQLAAALAVTTDGIGIVNAGGGLEFVNHAFARLFHDRPGNLIHRSWTERFSAEEALRIQRDVVPLVTRLGAWSGEVEGLRSDGAAFPLDLSVTMLPTGGLVCMMRDVSERKQLESVLRTQAIRDELTQLYNRRGFFQVASGQLQDLVRRKQPAVLLYGDADRFKLVNDTYGHDVGDQVLRLIADVLRTELRSTDVVARLGGDEFTALLPDTDIGSVVEIQDKLQRALAEAAAKSDCPATIGMSIGVAIFDPAMPESVDALLQRADRDLYDIKGTRRRARAA